MSFTRVSPDELAKAFVEPEWAEDFLDELIAASLWTKGPYGYLGKSWAGIQYLLDAARVDVEFFMDGDPVGEKGYLHGWPPKLVAETARKLSEASFERLALHHDAERMDAEDVYPGGWSASSDGGLEDLRKSYEGLVVFFVDATARGFGAVMSFSN
ncbi:YfbM family protein [Stackebrandtia soli]|uniref:YfbM family protein n=1 Tax=Stackebrandtia soli TaxID=1892856 RepID=UPI0039E82B5E